MPIINLNMTNHYYEDTGGDGPVILFVHGLFFDSRMFAEQIAILKNDYRCVSLDWRSQGRSENVPFGHDADGLVNDAKALIETLELAPCHLVGVSVGGVIAIRLAAQYPNLIKSVVGIGSSGQNENIATLTRYEEMFDSFTHKGVASVIDTLMPLIFGKRFNTDPALREKFDFWKNHILSNNAKAVGRAAAPILRRVDITHMLSHVHCPACFIVGEDDGVNGVDKANTIAKGIDGAQVVVMKETGHTPPIESPQELTKILADFFSSQIN